MIYDGPMINRNPIHRGPKVGLFSAVAAVVALIGLVGCESPVYITIPSEESSVALDYPQGRNVRIISVQTLQAVALASPDAAAGYEFFLVEGSTIETYGKIAETLGPLAIIPGDEPLPDVPVFAIESIRIRGDRGTVDVIRPHPTRRWELVEVRLVYQIISGWSVSEIRPRRIEVDAPPRPILEDLLPVTAPTTQPDSLDSAATQPEAVADDVAATQPAE